MPWDHFSILPSTPQAVSPRKIGRVKGASPAAGVSMARMGPSAVVVDACVSIGVITAPSRPIAVFLPLSRLPMVCPSAPLTWPSGRRLAVGAGDEDGLDQVECFAKLFRLLQIGRDGRRRARALQLLDQRQQPLQQRGDVIRPRHWAGIGQESSSWRAALTPRSTRRAFWVMASSMWSRRCMSRPSSENCIDRSAPDGRSNSRTTGAAPLNSQSTILFPSKSIAAAAAGVRSMPARLVRSSDSARGRAPVSQYLSSGPRALGYQGPTSTMSQRIDLSPLKTRTLGRGPENRQGSATPGRLGQPSRTSA